MKQINVAIQIQEKLRPKVFAWFLLADQQKLRNLTSEIDKLIVSEKQSFKTQFIALTENYLELNNTAKQLDVELEELTKVSFNETDLPNLYSEVLASKTIIETNQNILDTAIAKVREKGEYFNPLLSSPKSTIDNIIDNMTASEKAGQLLMFSIDGSLLDSNEAKNLEKLNVGGVILMGYNISSPEQLSKFTKAIQLNNDKTPLLIATDQEGGVVKRVKWDSTAGAKEWEKLSDEEVCLLASERSEILASNGINLNFAPVVDLTYAGDGFINNRTISNNPDIVIARAKQFVGCSQNNAVAATLKHFPGHGATPTDSHYYLPIIDKSKDDWLNSDALPFQQITDANFVMVGHLLMKQIDPENPATLSKVLLTDILRNEFNYQGLTISDDMYQLHVSTNMNYKIAIKKALEAGIDILLYVGYPSSRENIHAEIARLIETGEIDNEIIDAKLRRILNFKYSL